MQKEWIEGLKNSDPVVRKRTIIAMAESHDEDALRILKAIYEKDSDPQMRELAKKAGAHLWKTITADKTAAAPTVRIKRNDIPKQPVPQERFEERNIELAEQATSPDSGDTPESSPISIPSVDINSKQIAMARIHVARATALVVKGDKMEALRYLQNACHINPELLNEELVINLASELTGLPKREAIQAMVTMKASPSTQSAAAQNRTLLYIGIGIGIIAVLIIAAILLF
jgi:hypothetical protein